MKDIATTLQLFDNLRRARQAKEDCQRLTGQVAFDLVGLANAAYDATIEALRAQIPKPSAAK